MTRGEESLMMDAWLTKRVEIPLTEIGGAGRCFWRNYNNLGIILSFQVLVGYSAGDMQKAIGYTTNP